MSRCPHAYCRGQLWRYPSVGNDPDYVACLQCGRGTPTRIPTGDELRNRVMLPVARRVEAGAGS